jgi:hypothetical protein
MRDSNSVGVAADRVRVKNNKPANFMNVSGRGSTRTGLQLFATPKKFFAPVSLKLLKNRAASRFGFSTFA